MLAGFKIFSGTTGLQINASKSEFYCVGMEQQVVEKIVRLSSFKLGIIPFKYLGVPMSHKKLNVADCDILIEKMCSRIKTWNSRNLSYAGRLQLINSVLIISKVYHSLLEQGQKVHWDRVVWNRLAIPKHRFIYWLVMWRRLMTKDRLSRMGIQQDATFALCQQADESVEHLFFSCKKSLEIAQETRFWIGCACKSANVYRITGWIQRNCTKSKYRRKLYLAWLVAAVYFIWRCRNEIIWQNKKLDVNNIIAWKYLVKYRSSLLLGKKVA
ncbi:hypothetical protein RDABS01_039096 [Bienertia sinuspersici]